MIGAAIADGKIGSVDDRVIQYVPEIAGRGLDELTIRDLLLMNSGIRYLHGHEIPFYMAPFSDDAVTYYPPDLRKVALSVKASGTPIGEAFRYNNYHMLLEGLIIERATGLPVATYLQERIWKWPIVSAMNPFSSYHPAVERCSSATNDEVRRSRCLAGTLA